jgi:hypothetical protein
MHAFGDFLVALAVDEEEDDLIFPCGQQLCVLFIEDAVVYLRPSGKNLFPPFENLFVRFGNRVRATSSSALRMVASCSEKGPNTPYGTASSSASASRSRALYLPRGAVSLHCAKGDTPPRCRSLREMYLMRLILFRFICRLCDKSTPALAKTRNFGRIFRRKRARSFVPTGGEGARS